MGILRGTVEAQPRHSTSAPSRVFRWGNCREVDLGRLKPQPDTLGTLLNSVDFCSGTLGNIVAMHKAATETEPYSDDSFNVCTCSSLACAVARIPEVQHPGAESV